MATKADRYEGIDGLKAYAIIGIALIRKESRGRGRTEKAVGKRRECRRDPRKTEINNINRVDKLKFSKFTRYF